MTEANLIWKFREAPQDGGEKGGDAAEHAFPSGLDTLVREIIQNSKDQDLNEGPVKIKFEFIDLAGPKRNLLEQALDWDYLHTHLEAVANLPYPGADRVRRELEELDQLPHLRILRISDYGTKGLIGPEISADAEGEDEGNFAPLLRNELTNSRRSGGGSFGLGKSVLWNYSGIGTVLFFSELHEFQSQPSKFRLMGRAHHPSHSTLLSNKSENWAGPGWFGQQDERLGCASNWDTSQETITNLQLQRDDGSGVSILIVDFDEPNIDEDRKLVDIANDLYHSVEKNYWPALLQGGLEVSVSVIEHENVEYEKLIGKTWEPTDAIKPFVDAWKKSKEDCLENFTGNVDEVVDASITVNVPERKADLPAPETDVDGTLRLISFPSTEDLKESVNKVALIRGAGMVVKYESFPVKQDLDYSVCGFFSAGKSGRDLGRGGHNTTELTTLELEHEDRLEFFLRSCEPPAHHEWTSTTKRCQKYFPKRAWTALNNLLGPQGTIRQALDKAVYIEPPPGGRIPEGLGRLLRFGKGGVSKAEGKVTASGNAILSDGIWEISGRISNTRPTADWAGKLSVGIRQDGSTKGPQLDIVSARIDGVDVEPDAGSVFFTASSDSVTFEVTTDPNTEYSPILDSCQIWMNAIKVKSVKNG